MRTVTPITLVERRLSALISALAVVLVELVLVATPASFPSYDEAKYIGIGYSFLAGDGPRTQFGAIFLPHSPLWPAIVDAPAVWFGLDPLSWGHLLNAISVGGLLLLVAWFGWQVRPAVGAAAAVAYAGFPYLFELARTARLDVPVAALCLLYIVVAVIALERRSLRWALVAGLVFGIAFLVKEIALPFAPVPFLIAFARGIEWRAIARVLAGVVLVAAVATSWWFVEYAQLTRHVYRLGTPAWTLVPLVVLAGLVVVGGLLLGRDASIPPASGPPHTAGDGGGVLPSRSAARSDRIRRGMAWLAAAGWFVMLTVFFQVQGTLQGAGLFQLRQYQLYAALWLPSWPVRIVAALALVGALVALVRLFAPRTRTRDGIELMAMTLLCTLPLVLLVFAVGEPPRNYLAQLGLFIALSAAGWIGLVDRAIVGFRARRAGTPISGDAQRPLPGWVVGAGLGLVVLLAGFALTTHAIDHRTSPTGTARQSAVDAADGWIRANVPHGTPIGFGSLLAYETAVPLRGDWTFRQFLQRLTVADISATYGLRPVGGATGDDWLAIDRVERTASEFYVFQAKAFGDAIRAAHLEYFVYATGTTTSVPSLLGALTPDRGFTQVAAWRFPVTASSAGPDAAISIAIFKIDPSRLDMAGSPIFLTAAALDRLTGLFEGAGASARTAAANLAAHAVVTPPDPAGDALLARLRALTGP
jgi:4-amino-4-deoxy-L-arabinose transferase-like glycosyltransferase